METKRLPIIITAYAAKAVINTPELFGKVFWYCPDNEIMIPSVSQYKQDSRQYSQEYTQAVKKLLKNPTRIAYSPSEKSFVHSGVLENQPVEPKTGNYNRIIVYDGVEFKVVYSWTDF